MQIICSSKGKELGAKIVKSRNALEKNNLELLIPEIKIFPSGEYICKLTAKTTGPVCIVGSIISNDDLIELLTIIDAVKRSGSTQIILVAPYIAYGRQNVMQKPFSSVGIEIIANILNATGISSLITADIHDLSSLELFKMQVIHISSVDILKYYKEALPKNALIVAPDKGAEARLSKLNMEIISLKKQRKNGNIEIFIPDNVKIKGRNCIIVDDILDSGKTMEAAAKLLVEKGANEVKGYVTHLIGEKSTILEWTTDSISKDGSITKQLSLAPLISGQLFS